MKVLLAGGGTAGHINPAIAIANTLKQNQPECEILFAGVPTGMEAKIIPNSGFNFTPINVRGFQRSLTPKNIIRNVEAVKCLLTSSFRAKKIIDDFKPDLVIGTGGYVSGPIVLTAHKKGIKTLIHEQNAFPGVTTKILSKKVDKVLLASEKAKQLLPNDKNCEVVGNPIRQNIIFASKQKAREQLGLKDELCILSFGGSLGAKMINRVAADVMEWHNNKNNVFQIHAYGKFGKEYFPEYLRERNVDYSNSEKFDIREYIDNMDICLAAADLVICRAGAITISELEATGKPAILIPSPNVAENHQYHNAMELVENQAGILIEEDKYSKKELFSKLDDLYSNRENLKKIGENASKLAILDSCEKIYDIIQKIVK